MQKRLDTDAATAMLDHMKAVGCLDIRRDFYGFVTVCLKLKGGVPVGLAKVQIEETHVIDNSNGQ